jgi:hypothetical protein
MNLTESPINSCVEEEISPAAAFRNNYYLSQQLINQPSVTEDEDNDFVYRPGAIIYAPLNPRNNNNEQKSFLLLSDEEEEEDMTSIKTIGSDHTSTLYEPKSDLEPKIVLHDKSSTLLSKLSKSTAPMRAKLSQSKSKTYKKAKNTCMKRVC